MTGFSAILGGDETGLGELREGVRHTGAESVSEYADERCSVCVVTHGDAADDQPAAAADGDVLIWVWGDLFGRDDGERYARRSDLAPGATDAEYCAALFDRCGADFLAGLNGEFAGGIYDRTAGTFDVFTDRIGLRPVYDARGDAGEVVVSTELQAIPTYPTVETGLVTEYVYEYLASRRAFGTRTPLRGVERIPPGSRMTVDLDIRETDTTRYWYPRYEPVDRPFGECVEQFTDCLLEILDERVRDDRRYGVLLSGGADSRLILAGLRELDEEPIAFHMNEWTNREARIAERVADAADTEFRFLRRDADYLSRALERDTALTEFVSWFDQAHANGFADELREAVDVVIGGEYSGEAVGNFTDFPTHSVRTGLGLLHLPVRKRIDTVEEYLDVLDDDLPPYLETPPTLREILAANLTSDGTTIEHHGVRYESMEDLIVFSELYPATNDADHLNYRGTSQVIPHWTPFLDARMIEFTRTYPHAYRLRRKIVNQAVKRLDPELADIPYANTGLPLGYPFPVHYAANRLQQFRHRNLPFVARPTPAPHYTHGSWPDSAEVLRHQSLLEDTLERRADLIRRLPFLDEAGIRECYREHLDGADNSAELFTLLTFLEMPVTERVVDDPEPDPGTRET